MQAGYAMQEELQLDDEDMRISTSGIK